MATNFLFLILDLIETWVKILVFKIVLQGNNYNSVKLTDVQCTVYTEE